MDSTLKRPDGGYGWVIVACGFLLHMLNVGLFSSLSYLYVSWLDEFGQGKGTTSWVISLGVGLTFMLAPIPARLVEIFSYRTVTIFGSLLTSAGYVMASFAPSVPFLIGSLGGVTGVGCAFTYINGVSIIGLYFDKRRSLAMGLSTCGVGVGTMIVPPLLNALEGEYGWRGCLFIMGALALHKCVAGMLMRTPDHRYVSTVEVEVTRHANSATNGTTYDHDYAKIGHQHTNSSDFHTVVLGSNDGRIHLDNGEADSSSDGNAPEAAEERGDTDEIPPSKTRTDPQNHPSSADSNLRGRHYYCSCKDSPCLLANVELLKSKLFCLLVVSNVLSNLAYMTPLVYLVDRAMHNGIDKSVGALLIVLNGAGNLLGRVLTGMVCSRLQLNSLPSYIFVLVVCGTVTMASPLCGSVPALHGVYAAAFGFFIGGFVVLAPVVVMDLMGPSRLATAYGLLLFLLSGSNILGPPIAGWVFDLTRNYTLSYILNGLFLVTSGLMLLPVLLSRKCGCRWLADSEMDVANGLI